MSSGLDQVVNSCYSKLLYEYDNFMDRWETFAVKKGVNIFVNKNYDIHMYMGSVTIETCLTQDQVSELIKSLHIDVATMKKWDKRLSNLEILSMSDDTAVVYASYHFEGSLMIKDRDFLFAFKKYVDEKQRIHFVSTSVEKHGEKLNSNFVRGKILTNGWLVQKIPNEPNKFTFIYVVQTDPCGKITPWLVNKVSVDRILLINKIKAYIETNHPKKKL